MKIRLEHKAATAAMPAVGGVIDSDDRYSHTIIGSVTGVVDEVGDLIEPGAYTKTLAARKPKVIKDHDWGQRLGRADSWVELMPGDTRLPKTTADGSLWPAKAGALVGKVRLFEGTTLGDEAAARWTAEGAETQFSIGYVVPKGKSWKDKGGVRHIDELVCVEVSDVLWGANPLAGLLPAGLATKMLAEGAISEADLPEGSEDGEDGDPGIGMVDDIAAEPGDSLFDDDEPGDADEDDDDLGDVSPDDVEDVTDEDLDAAEGTAAAAAENFTDDDDSEPAGDEEPVDEVKIMLAGMWDTEVKRAFSPGKRRKLAMTGVARSDGSFPIESEADLRNAIQAVGRSGDPEAAKRHVRKRAKALGKTDLIPDSWGGSKALDDDLPLERKYDTSPVGTPGGRQNWVDKAGGLPPFIRAVAHALIRSGHSKSKAIAIAVGTIKRWAAGGGDVSEKTRAKAAKTVAEWEAKKAAGRRKAALDGGGWDPTLETGPFAAHRATHGGVEVKSSTRPAGSVESTLEALEAAVHDLLNPPRSEGDAPTDSDSPSSGGIYVSIDGTYADHVIATRSDYGRPGRADRESFAVPYQIVGTTDGGDPVISLGAPEPVELEVIVVPGDRGDEGDAPDTDVPHLMHAAAGLAEKVLGLHGEGGTEVKRGAVLSGVNSTRLRDATERLLAVLSAAGVDLTGILPGKPQQQGDHADADAAAAAVGATETKTAPVDVADDGRVDVAEHLAFLASLRAAATT